MKKFFLIAIIFVLLICIYTLTNLDNNISPISSDLEWHSYQIAFEIRKSVDSQNSISLLMPIPMEDGLFIKNFKLKQVIPENGKEIIDENGNRFIYWEPTSAKNFSVYMELSLAPVIYNIKSASIRRYNMESSAYTKYTSPSMDIQSNETEIVKKGRKIVGEETNSLKKAVLIQKWIENNISYSHEYRDALGTLEAKNSNCSGQSFLFVALCRSLGIPARQISGLHGIEKTLNSGSLSDGGIRAHIWAEYYIEGPGWIQAEPASSALGFGWETLPMSRGDVVFENITMTFMHIPLIVEDKNIQQINSDWDYTMTVDLIH